MVKTRQMRNGIKFALAGTIVFVAFAGAFAGARLHEPSKTIVKTVKELPPVTNQKPTPSPTPAPSASPRTTPQTASKPVSTAASPVTVQQTAAAATASPTASPVPTPTPTPTSGLTIVWYGDKEYAVGPNGTLWPVWTGPYSP